MSLRHGLLDLLAERPMCGYDLSQFFAASMGNVWPAQHSQIYPELGKLAAEGLIAQTGEGPRGRKEFQTTPAGLEELRRWMRETVPDYSVRYEPLLRTFCLWTLSTEQALAQLARDRAEYVQHLDDLEEVIVGVDWDRSPVTRAGRLAIEFGRRFYATQVEWIDWAVEQIEAGRLKSGNPAPGSDGEVRTGGDGG
jgi:DNA-binding PadR family transcriptional regulator